MENHTKLIWKQLDQTFDLQLKNPDMVHNNEIKKLNKYFKIVKETESWGRYFCKEAIDEFERWLKTMRTPLKEQSYARLSNWFLTSPKFIRKSPLGIAALEFWKM